MELLSILDEQVELLAKEDLSRFLDSLVLCSVIPPTKVLSLRAEYRLERVSWCLVVWRFALTPSQEPVPQGCLAVVIENVVEGIGHVLGKHPLFKDDSVVINGSAELTYGMFDRLRSQAWLNNWDIAAALEITNRPEFVQLGLSIPLHKADANGDVTPILNPFRG
ncbi:unnamed protein product [Sphagnum balticum]